jgi:hypothetical protein
LTRERTERAHGAVRLPGAKRLTSLFGVADRRERRAHAPTYAEEEVRDRIYGWRSGSVEPPEPVDAAPPVQG